MQIVSRKIIAICTIMCMCGIERYNVHIIPHTYAFRSVRCYATFYAMHSE